SASIRMVIFSMMRARRASRSSADDRAWPISCTSASFFCSARSCVRSAAAVSPAATVSAVSAMLGASPFQDEEILAHLEGLHEGGGGVIWPQEGGAVRVAGGGERGSDRVAELLCAALCLAGSSSRRELHPAGPPAQPRGDPGRRDRLGRGGVAG